MLTKNKINILMISSSSSLGGGTKHMFMLGQNLNSEFNVFYGIPKNCNFENYLDNDFHIEISERKLSFIDILRLFNFIKSKSIDIIHAHGKGAGLISRILIILTWRPLIYTFHGIHLKCHSKFTKIIYILYEFIFGGLDSIKILVSKSEKEYAHKSNIYLGNKYKIIHNGVNNMLKKNHKENRNLKSKKVKVISVCRFVNQKNIKDILKIAEKINSVNFYIIGDGPLWKEIKYTISKRKLKNVNLLGEKKNVFRYLYSADIFLSTSLYEGLPISILEAMSVGLPILASNVVGNKDTIENGKSGFLYDLENIDMAVCYLKKLSKSKVLRKKFGNSAFNRQRIIFSKKSMVNQYMQIYKNQLNSK